MSQEDRWRRAAYEADNRTQDLRRKTSERIAALTAELDAYRKALEEIAKADDMIHEESATKIWRALYHLQQIARRALGHTGG